MMKKGCLLLCATALSLAWLDNQAQASINFNLKAPPVPSYAKLHTSHTSHLMARHLSSPSFKARELKVAQVCWITDTELSAPIWKAARRKLFPQGVVMPTAVSEWGMIKPLVRAAIKATNIVR